MRRQYCHYRNLPVIGLLVYLNSLQIAKQQIKFVFGGQNCFVHLQDLILQCHIMHHTYCTCHPGTQRIMTKDVWNSVQQSKVIGK